MSSLKISKDLITYTIVGDNYKSPFIGYVITHKSKSSSDLPDLANTFVDKSTINKKVTSEIQSSIDSTNKLKTSNAVIKCNFGMEIGNWHCSTLGLLSNNITNFFYILKQFFCKNYILQYLCKNIRTNLLFEILGKTLIVTNSIMTSSINYKIY